MFKTGIEYIVRSHPIKETKYFQTMEQLKRKSYASKTMFVPSMTLKHKTTKTNHKNVLKESEIVQQVSLCDKLSCVPVMKSQQGTISFMSVCLVLLFILFIFSSMWMITKNMDVYMDGKWNSVLCNFYVVLMILWMSNMYRF